MTASCVQRRRIASWLATLAVVLLTWAGVRSTVMQVQMAAPAATCSEMAGMAMLGGHAGKSTPAKPRMCAYCAAAAHAPTQAAAPGVAPSSAVVVFARYEAPASLGPRGPPSRRATARGPPSNLST